MADFDMMPTSTGPLESASQFVLAPKAPRGLACEASVQEWIAPIHSASIVVASSTIEEGTTEHEVRELTPLVVCP